MKLNMMFILVAIALGFSSAPHAEEAMYGVMMVVKGEVKVTSASDGKTEVAKVGKKVFSGDTITAGADARAKIVMSDKNVLNISPDSKLVIEKYTNSASDKNVQLKVEYGKIRASVEQKYDGEKSKFNVKTPSAVAGVRGTDFLTGYNASTKQTQVITFHGTVAVGAPGPGGTISNPVMVKPGQMTTASEGSKPEAPKPVPADDLNKMKKESNADTAAAKKPEAAPQQQAESKEKEKKDKDGEKKPEAKAEAKADPKAEAKADAKADPKAQAKADASGAAPAPGAAVAPGGGPAAASADGNPPPAGATTTTSRDPAALAPPPPPPPPPSMMAPLPPPLPPPTFAPPAFVPPMIPITITNPANLIKTSNVKITIQ